MSELRSAYPVNCPYPFIAERTPLLNTKVIPDRLSATSPNRFQPPNQMAAGQQYRIFHNDPEKAAWQRYNSKFTWMERIKA
jgi:hypothetical protein